MKIGDLFVSLGIKGGEKTMSTLQGTRKGLTDAAGAGWEMKAAIVAAMYAVEKLFASSGKYGTDLTNMNSALGISMQTMQEYRYAALQVGVSNEEMVGTFKSLQTAMTKTLTGQGSPGGMQWLAEKTGNITSADEERYTEHPEELFQRIQTAIRRTPNVAYGNDRSATFGISAEMAGTMRRNAYRPEVFAKAPKYTDKQIGQLDRNRAGFANVENSIEMMIGSLNAEHGAKLIAGINAVLPKVKELVSAFSTLTEKSHFFDGLGEVFKGWSMIFKEMTDGVVKLTTIMDDLSSKDPKKKQRGEDTARQWMTDKGGAFWEMTKAAGDVLGEAALGALDQAGSSGTSSTTGSKPATKLWNELQTDSDGGAVIQAVKAVGKDTLDLANKAGLTAFGYRPTGDEATPVPTQPVAPGNEPKAAEVFHNGPALTGTNVDARPRAPLTAPTELPKLRPLPPLRPAASLHKLQLLPPLSPAASARAALPRAPAPPAPAAAGDGPITVNQTMHFEGKTEPKENASEMKRAVQSAFRQYGVLTQGS